MVVSREPVCKPCSHDPINMLTEELRAFNRGEVTAEDVDTLKQSPRKVIQATDALPVQPIISGRHKDHFRKVDEQWCFASREMIVDLIGNCPAHLL